jgi:glutaryl-CoA dehydrogenase
MRIDMLADETYAEDALSTTEIGRSLGTDYFGLRHELTDAERDYLRRTRAFVDNDALPVINGCRERAQFPWPLIKKMGTLGIVGDGIKGYGCPPMSPVAAGLINIELNRGDGSLGTFQAVRAGYAVDLDAWLRAAEAALAARDGPARQARSVRSDRGGARFGRRRPGDRRHP